MNNPERETKHRTCSAKKSCLSCMTRFLVYHPLKLMLGSFFIIVLITIIGFFTNSYGITEETSYVWVIPDGRATLDYEATLDAQDRAVDTPLERQNAFTLNGGGTFWMTFDFERNADIFTPENVQTMCEVEQLFLTIPEYQDFCILRSDVRQCIEATETISFQFYGSATTACTLLSAANVTAQATRLYNALDSPDLQERQAAAFFMGEDTLSRNPRFTSITRSRVQLGTPLEGFISQNDDLSEQQSEYIGFYETVKDEFFDFFGLKSQFLNSAYRQRVSRGDLRVKWYSPQLQSIEERDTILEDLYLVSISIVFVYAWMTYQMSSLFLATMAMIQIVLSIPVSIVVYTHIFQIPFFQFLHILVIFLVLGIGADDVFVFYDGWRLSEHNSDVTSVVRSGMDGTAVLESRMKIAYERTFSAVFNTSFTTIVAFMATAISPIMPIATFGILASTCIFFNFVFVVTVFPSVVMMHHLWFVKRNCCRFREGSEQSSSEKKAGEGAKAPQPLPNDAMMEYADQKRESDTKKDFDKSGLPNLHEGQAVPPPQAEIKANGGASELKASERHSTVAGTVGRPSTALQHTDVALAIHTTTPGLKKEPTASSDGSGEGTRESDGNGNPNLEDDDDIDEAEMTLLDKFVYKAYLPVMTYRVRGVPVLAVCVTLGLLVFAIVAISAASMLGPPPEQENFLTEDNMLAQVPSELQDDFIRGDLDPFVEVFIPFGIQGFERPGFNRFEPGKNRGNVVFDNDFDFFTPEAQATFNRACALAATYSCGASACQDGRLFFPESIQCFLPEFQAWFLNRTGITTTDPSLTREHFFGNLSEFRVAPPADADGLSQAEKQAVIGFIDGELRYVRIDTRVTALSRSSTSELSEVRDATDDYANAVNGDAPDGMNNAFSSSAAWVGVEAEFGIVQGFFIGLILCFPVAYVVLVLATSNFLISFYAIISIGFIVSSVLATAQWRGWNLGVAEAVAGVIVIGFSVDYVIHLGHMYIDASHTRGLKSRLERFVYASKKIVATVLAGGITTFGAALPLLACQLTFFPKMGTLMASTIAFSLLFSIGFFMGLALLIGPVDRIGDITWVLEKIGVAPFLERYGCLKRNPHAPEPQKDIDGVEMVQRNGSAAKTIEMIHRTASAAKTLADEEKTITV
eukprot:CAMPEP_0184481728 /NCGR_PEP_ID=MMETSP0113_2-20130426/3300_1 /TAXON_ID=91329 /ORGANISM="Norrisiella sphaerica, Strain BC52" /LENGTH=1146 /DNA_ID=CAMNT_0026861037 /DNA_START=22 /DNA_END=3462 /DNA_ORIENTATION=+